MRLIGTLMDNPEILDTVYNKKHTYIGDNIINGYPYAVSYTPYTLDEGGKAMLFWDACSQLKKLKLIFFSLFFLLLFLYALFFCVFFSRPLNHHETLHLPLGRSHLSMDTRIGSYVYTDIDLDDEVGLQKI